VDLRFYGIVALIRYKVQIEIEVQGKATRAQDTGSRMDTKCRKDVGKSSGHRILERRVSWNESRQQSQDLRVNANAVETNKPDRRRQPEPAWSRAPGIEPENTVVAPFGKRFVRVPEDNDVRTSRNRITCQIAPIVDHVYAIA